MEFKGKENVIEFCGVDRLTFEIDEAVVVNVSDLLDDNHVFHVAEKAVKMELNGEIVYVPLARVITVDELAEIRRKENVSIPD